MKKYIMSYHLLLHIAVYVLAMSAMCLIVSCKTTASFQKQMIKRTETSDTTRVQMLDLIQRTTRVDSVRVHDSIFVLCQGDTVRETRWRTEYKILTVHDTLTLVKADTLAIQRNQEERSAQERETQVEKTRIPKWIAPFIIIGILTCLLAFYWAANWLAAFIKQNRY